MRRKIRWMLITLLVLLITGQVVYADNVDITQQDIDEGIDFCKDYPVFLQVDGMDVSSDVPPVIIKERTLLPARAVFESMGAAVTWNEEARLVEVSLGTSTVQLTIDSKTAFVNGKQVAMDVPAMIIDSRTLIPVRFVGESLACGIGWNDTSRTVIITSPKINEITTISAIDVVTESEEEEKFYRVIIQGEDVIEGYKSFAYDDPNRFGIDIKGAALMMEDDSVDVDNDMIQSVRFSQFEEDSVRVVVDLNEKVLGKVSFSSDNNNLYIDFDKDQVKEYENLGDVTVDGLDVVDWRATGKLVAIDPGHGGKDTGSQAIRDGVEILNEKDINLDIALRLNRMLQAAGVSTYILRETDASINIYDRPALANTANASLYISVHNNSTDKNPNARGVEVYYNSKESESNYGIYSKHLAEVAYQELFSTLGTLGRGAKNEPAYIVLNRTEMPAIIIEGAFLSNTDDLKLMMTDEFRENYAKSVAKAIIQILNESVKE